MPKPCSAFSNLARPSRSIRRLLKTTPYARQTAGSLPQPINQHGQVCNYLGCCWLWHNSLRGGAHSIQTAVLQEGAGCFSRRNHVSLAGSESPYVISTACPAVKPLSAAHLFTAPEQAIRARLCVPFLKLLGDQSSPVIFFFSSSTSLTSSSRLLLNSR